MCIRVGIIYYCHKILLTIARSPVFDCIVRFLARGPVDSFTQTAQVKVPCFIGHSF